MNALPKKITHPSSGHEFTTITLQRHLQILLKRKWLILSALVVTLGCTSIWVFTQTPIYRATATVLLDYRAPQILGEKVHQVVDVEFDRPWRSSKRYLETQKKLVTSITTARQVADQTGLMHNEIFWGERKLKEPRSLQEATDKLRSITTVVPTKNANILEISVDHTNSELATTLSNALAQIYMDQNIGYQIDSATGAVKWLADQLDDLKKELESAEMALHNFKKKNNIISVSLKDRQSLIARQIWKLNDQLTDVQMKRISLAARRKQVQAVLKSKDGVLQAAIAPVQNSETVQALRVVYVNERRRYLSLLEKYLEKHPIVLQQKANVDAAYKDLETEIRSILAGVESEYEETRDTETKLAAALQTANDEGLEINKREVSYRRLLRQQENTEQLYSIVLSRMKESDLSAQLKVSNVRWLDRAIIPGTPTWPRVNLTLLVGVLIGLFLGIGLAYLVELTDNSIKSQEEVEDIPGLVFLGLMQRIPGTPTSSKRSSKRPSPTPESDLYVHRNSKSAVAESCRAIRTNLLFASPDRPLKTIVVTSAGPREGKTTTSVSLSITMAQAGSRTLIMDTDMRRPRLHRIFGVPGSEGITSILLGNTAIDEVIKSTEAPNLFVLPCGPTPPNPAELCQSERFKQLLEKLKERFDKVILDSPPVMVVTDAVLLSTLVDGTLIMARTGHTSKAALRDAARHLQDVGSNLIGAVLNDMDIETGSYGYYRYRRYGYYRYGYYRYGHYGDKEEEAAS